MIILFWLFCLFAGALLLVGALIAVMKAFGMGRQEEKRDARDRHLAPVRR
jgi:hypothetical protein